MKRMIFPGLFILAFVIFTLIMGAILSAGTSSPPPDMRIAVVMYGNGNGDRWRSLELGIRQACRDLEIESPIIITPGEDRQSGLIDREIADGVDGLLIAPENSEAQADSLEQLTFAIPIVFIMNGIESFSYVAADDAGMGRMLAEALSARSGRVLLIANHPPRKSAHLRVEAFLSYMAEAGVPVAPLDSLTAAAPGDIVVALDTETLESAIDFFAESPGGITLCGIGGSDKVVHALSQGIVDSVVFQNEYAMGYTATMALAEKLGIARPIPDMPIQYLYADRKTMYEPDIANLLFSIVQ